MVDNHAFGISSYDSNAMKSPNPNSSVYEADTSRTLDLNGGNPACNQGGVAIVALEGNGQRPSHMGDGYAETDKSYTLNTTEVHGVAYSVDMGGGKSAFNILEDQSPTLTCTHYGEPAVSHNDRSNCYTCKPGMMLRFNNKMDKDLSVTIDTAGGTIKQR